MSRTDEEAAEEEESERKKEERGSERGEEREKKKEEKVKSARSFREAKDRLPCPSSQPTRREPRCSGVIVH